MNGVNGVSVLQKGVYEGKETCQRGVYIWYMLHFAYTRKSKKHYPETSVNNS